MCFVVFEKFNILVYINILDGYNWYERFFIGCRGSFFFFFFYLHILINLSVVSESCFFAYVSFRFSKCSPQCFCFYFHLFVFCGYILLIGYIRCSEILFLYRIIDGCVGALQVANVFTFHEEGGFNF